MSMSEGTKYDEDKPPLGFLPRSFLEATAHVYAHGAKKYGRDNWRKGFAYTRTLSSTLRHLYAWSSGEDKDQESGLSHLWHAAANLSFLIEFEYSKTGTDDRYRLHSTLKKLERINACKE